MTQQGREEHVQVPFGSTPAENLFGHGIGRIKVGIEGVFFVGIPQQQLESPGGTVQPGGRNRESLGQCLHR